MFFNFGLIGYPLGHSLSPKIHTTALQACGLLGSYALFPILPDDQHGLADLLARVRGGELHGLNVTIPHKQNVMPLLDELTPTAQAIGAVNTISMQNGQLTGDNTDAPGFLADLKKFLTTETRRRGDKNSALVLGAGGGARAVVYALVNAGWNVAITDIHPKQTEALVAHFSFPESRLASIEYTPAALRALLPELNLIVNATPVGMSPNEDGSPWPERLPLPSSVAIYDLVYNPRKTKLVKDAHVAGLPAVTGLGMLVEQAALSFEVWTGCAPSRDALRAAVN
ncbi:MAG: shikimate dehydrogenase [Chloroflexota bacterium]